MSERGLNHLDNMIQNEIIQPLLTDLYQFTMAYSYWKSGKMNDIAIFDLYFRKNPFHGEFTVFAGLEECMKFLEKFHISDSDLHYLKKILPSSVEPEFFQYLKALTVNDVILSAIDEGTVVFPKVPLIKVEGPLPVVQILETCFLNLINYASLVATNAVRFRLAAGPEMGLFEFGLRRAQGPDGALSASRYCYLGGFDGTSNVLAGKLYGIPLKGTHAHAFVTSFSDTQSLTNRVLKRKDNGKEVDFVNVCLMWKEKLSIKLSFMKDQVSDGELAAFATYAISFPNAFLALIDTYDVIKSGLPNFCAVAMALHELGYEPKGIRLDSGDLAYLSQVSRETFQIVSKIFNLPMFARLKIVASNDINEDTIHSLNQQNHQIDCYGIGTHLVTCQKQPALGCVFKLVEINGKPRIKLSEDPEKITIPGKKNVYRLYGTDGIALVDLLQQQGEPAPCVGERVFCRHPFQETKRAYVLPAKVENLYKVYWKDGKVQQPLPKLTQLRDKTMQSLQHMRQDHKRALQPSPYKVSVSASLYTFMHELWLQNAPIGELS